MATEPLYGVTVKDVDQTLDYILAHHSSVARFGDGEIDLIAGRDIPYQFLRSGPRRTFKTGLIHAQPAGAGGVHVGRL